VLGWNRGADIVSEMIPQIYFDYLRGGPPDALVPIFRHNQMDLVGLARLATRVLSLLAHPETDGQDALEIFGASRICERRGHTARARNLYQRSIDGDLPPAADRAARRSLAKLAKRDGDHARACEIWEEILENLSEGLDAHFDARLEAYQQLAIHYERRAGDPERALALARRAMSELRGASRLGTISAIACRVQRERFEARASRLEEKVQKTRKRLLNAGKPPLPGSRSLDADVRLPMRKHASPANRRGIQQLL
jgi:tetratricopeptide (TPR) repeat protein